MVLSCLSALHWGHKASAWEIASGAAIHQLKQRWNHIDMTDGRVRILQIRAEFCGGRGFILRGISDCKVNIRPTKSIAGIIVLFLNFIFGSLSNGR
ncbi:MAG TPA: hypothetical protein VMW16_07540 [Sedimentisphaerales bacterium]|nr:hypothetical protein [Sedimentisphaerales bacterium]